MKRLTTASLAWISLLAVLSFSGISCARQAYSPAGKPLNIEQFTRYHVDIATPKAGFSGIVILKQIDERWEGRMINEFGVGMFDFSVRNGKCRLRNIMPALNKWYIRKTVEDDLAFLIGKANSGLAAKGRTVEREADGFILVNTRRHIRYTFHPIRS
jgi:hypothetical protein